MSIATHCNSRDMTCLRSGSVVRARQRLAKPVLGAAGAAHSALALMAKSHRMLFVRHGGVKRERCCSRQTQRP